MVEFELDGEKVSVAFGSRLVLGRSGADIIVAAPGVSRRHLAITRRADGCPEISDLGSRNGTSLRNIPLSGTVPVDGELRLVLGGGHVPVIFRPRAEGGLELDVSERRIVAALGPFYWRGWRLDIGRRWLVGTRRQNGSVPGWLASGCSEPVGRW